VTLICGHRGARRERPENTLASFKRALELGADMVELDVRFTADSIAVIHHDSKIDGTFISARTFAEAREQAEKRGFKLATLEEILNFAHTKIKLDIELKEDGREEKLISMISLALDKNEFIISSFDDRIISKVKRLHPEIETGLLLGDTHPRQKYGHGHLESIFFGKRAHDTHADWLLFHSALLPFGVLSRAHRTGLKIGVWTVNRPHLMRRLLKDHRVELIITDLPGKAVSERKRLC